MSFYGNIFANPHLELIVQKQSGESSNDILKYDLIIKDAITEDTIATTTIELPIDTIFDKIEPNSDGNGIKVFYKYLDGNGNAADETKSISFTNLITTDSIRDNAVTTAKIADANITTAKIKDSAVTEDKIQNNAITTAKIKDNTVTTDKIVDSAVETDKIKDNAVVWDKLDVDTVKNRIATYKYDPTDCILSLMTIEEATE